MSHVHERHMRIHHLIPETLISLVPPMESKTGRWMLPYSPNQSYDTWPLPSMTLAGQSPQRATRNTVEENHFSCRIPVRQILGRLERAFELEVAVDTTVENDSRGHGVFSVLWDYYDTAIAAFLNGFMDCRDIINSRITAEAGVHNGPRLAMRWGPETVKDAAPSRLVRPGSESRRLE
ncbi:hypothetical protein BJX63DRAFT_433417 [Aspergillus granulosus]|uniref:Uncharacterized protein n=1 Tax=Aspergillus granulosus TaxID=176169 RepID=A0ABR4H800_9EURO